MAGNLGPVVVLAGDADRSSVTKLNEVLTAQVSARTTYLAIDATNLRSIERAAAQALMLAALIVVVQGGTAVLMNPRDPVLDVLNRGRVSEMFTVEDRTPPWTPPHSTDGGLSEKATEMTDQRDKQAWLIALRRRPANSGNGQPDSGTSMFEIICRMCGDDLALDYRQAPAELRRIRGSHTLMAGLAAFLRHQELHDMPEDG